MNASEQQIKIVAKMYEARDTLRNLWGAGWREKLKPAMEILQAYADRNAGGDILKSVLALSKKAGQYDAGTVLQLVAAGVELIEPTKEK